MSRPPAPRPPPVSAWRALIGRRAGAKPSPSYFLLVSYIHILCDYLHRLILKMLFFALVKKTLQTRRQAFMKEESGFCASHCTRIFSYVYSTPEKIPSDAHTTLASKTINCFKVTYYQSTKNLLNDVPSTYS